ncbi:MAG: hypothetical protein LN566_05015 [Rickettsia endosymbiont of Stiretrus anchorago]|nr:hypothetical protein [Rickettsia endosymbiont of Stiretrus anchorago]
MLNNDIKIEVMNLCDKITRRDKDIFEAFYKLYPLLDYFIIDDRLKNFCALILSETDWIPDLNKDNLHSKEFKKKVIKEQQEIIRFYDNKIDNFITQVLEELNKK